MADACGHNFCQTCLLAHIGGPYRSLLAEIGGGNEWLCPECRSEQSKKPNELIRNRLVERAVESFNATVNQNEVRHDVCRHLCSHHNWELTLCKFCMTCNLHIDSILLANFRGLNLKFFKNFISLGPRAISAD